MDTGLDENEAELGVLVLSVALEVLADGHSLICAVNIETGPRTGESLPILPTHLLDQHVQVLRELGGKACS